MAETSRAPTFTSRWRRVADGATIGVVGESGSGKSVTALSVLRLHARSVRRFPPAQFAPPGMTFCA